MVDVVINYFNPSCNNKIIYMTLVCVIAYTENKDVTNVVVVDGSGLKESIIKKYSREMKFTLLQSESKISFARGYNLGIDYCILNSRNKYIILSANDIFVDTSTVNKLLKKVSNGIGCIIPYLSNSDLKIQTLSGHKRKDRLPYGMTLNVNLFSKDDLVAINKVPEEYSGCFNDLQMFIKLRNLNKKILLVDGGNIIHVGRSTTKLISQVNYNKDLKTFSEANPSYIAKNKVKIRKFMQDFNYMELIYINLYECFRNLF